MFLPAWCALWRSTIPSRRRRGPAARRPVRPSPEALEPRLAPAVVGPIGARGTAPAMVAPARAGTVAADAAWLDDVARVVLGTTLPPEFVDRTADELARGLAPGPPRSGCSGRRPPGWR